MSADSGRQPRGLRTGSSSVAGPPSAVGRSPSALLRIIRDEAEALRTLLRRPPLEELPLPPAVAARMRAAYGEDLPPAAFVERVLDDVRRRGDEALRHLARALDAVVLEGLETTAAEVADAYHSVSPQFVQDCRLAAARIEAFHRQEIRPGWVDFERGLGQIIQPLERVGLYAPGGLAAYPSSVLMAAIPAGVAGVDEIILCSPPAAGGRVRPEILVAAGIAGIRRIFKVGGAPAIVAMALGTESVPRVDKILGPGNLFVVLAKRRVSDLVGIDQLSGPTETVVVADDAADAEEVAADLLAQAEHDPLASAILFTPSERLATCVAAAVKEQLATLERREIAAESLQSRGGAVITRDVAHAIQLANRYAPEHLCLLVEDAWSYVRHVRHAGGIFIGRHSPEAAGDYVAGPSHIMPTGGTARFASPLSVADFHKVTSLVALSPGDLQRVGPAAARLARAEGLTAHARAVELRLRNSQPVDQ